MDPSPKRRGRPTIKKPTGNNRGKRKEDVAEEKRQEQQAARLRMEAEKARLREEQVELDRLEQDRAILRAFNELRRAKVEGGYGFGSFYGFMAAVWTSRDQQVSAAWSRFCRDHGEEMFDEVAARAKDTGDSWAIQRLVPILKSEGQRIKEIMSRGRDQELPLSEMLRTFSMDTLGDELKRDAPTIWALLCTASGVQEDATTPQRDPKIVFTTMCAMMAVLQSQRANDYQTTLGLFLLASGSAKREIEVLAHAGLCTSYPTILDHLKQLSAEATTQYNELIKSTSCMLKDAQRMGSTDHFDNGTTATVIPLFDPTTAANVPHGTLPFSLNPPRQSRKLDVPYEPQDLFPTAEESRVLSGCCLWQIQQIAMDHIPNLARLRGDVGPCPVVEQIPVHTTKQYPLPAMQIDESSIDGTMKVMLTIFENLGMTNADWVKHGLLFVDGDLLTMLLVDKLQTARRNSADDVEALRFMIQRFGLFHCKMAAGRMVVNEHWGKPNSEWPGSLWWTNTQLGRKNMAAGWKGRKATPWKQSHELINITLAAHVKDAFRIHCGPDLEAWSAKASVADFETVARVVLDKPFSTHAVDDLRRLPPEVRDHAYENIILFNRDALFYVEFTHAIKRGDIGRVLSVLRLWGIMMRGVGAMPKYADVIFETLGRLRQYPTELRRLFLHNWLVNLTGRSDGFKEVDLMQEHQNFWAKIIYMAKGSNKSWDWLALVTVCIFTLRDAMRTVQSAFNIPHYGITHTVPAMTREVQALADLLEQEALQSYVPNRPGNDCVAPNFRADTRKATNLGHDGGVEAMDEDGLEEHEGDEGEDKADYSAVHAVGPSLEDVEADDEEYYGMAQNFLEQSIVLGEDIQSL
ncbi:hypothetical protein FB107DRAFT_294459 [Schizophyllum commune]